MEWKKENVQDTREKIHTQQVQKRIYVIFMLCIFPHATQHTDDKTRNFLLIFCHNFWLMENENENECRNNKKGRVVYQKWIFLFHKFFSLLSVVILQKGNSEHDFSVFLLIDRLLFFTTLDEPFLKKKICGMFSFFLALLIADRLQFD